MNIKVKENDFSKKLGMLKDAIDVDKQLGNSVGNIAVSGIMEFFVEGEGPDGKKWAPLHELTIEHLRKPGDGIAPLRKSGQLMGSVHFTVSGKTVTVRTNRMSKYWNSHKKDIAALHHFGGKSFVPELDENIPVPPRPFMGVSKDSKNEIADLAGKIARDISK